MHYVYLLHLSNKQIYVGYTNNLKRRYFEHKQGRNHTTKRFLPIKLIFYEAFVSKDDALKRERYLKSFKGKKTLQAMLKNTFLENNYARPVRSL
ncbi:MAG: GIY-YIG nuclease family protein [Patescibacteria group bacterium]